MAPRSRVSRSAIPHETEGPYPVQEADASGKITFTSIYPACYSGRWPHIHFEVYPSLSGATSVSNKVATSNVFSDGSSLELATITGSVAGGLTAALTIAV